MKNRKDMIIAVLTTFCISALMFAVIPIRSVVPYDPWADVRGTDPNDPNIPDGKIDMRDIGYIASQFMATGDPTKNVNVTNWPSQQKVGSYDFNTLTQNITIPANTSGNINIITDGYSRMTLGLTSSIDLDPITVNTGFMIGSFYAPIDSISMSGAAPKPANSIWLEPSIIPLMGKTGGYKFNVTAWTNLNTPSFCWQIKCTFNGDVFRVTRAGYTAGAKSQFFSGLNTVPVSPIITYNSVTHGETLVSGSRSAGSGSLCWFEFQVIAPSTEEHLIINYPLSDTFVLDPNLNVITTITIYDALASWNIWSSGEHETFKTYSVIGPILRIDYYNPNDDAASLEIDTYLTTAP